MLNPLEYVAEAYMLIDQAKTCIMSTAFLIIVHVSGILSYATGYDFKNDYPDMLYLLELSIINAEIHLVISIIWVQDTETECKFWRNLMKVISSILIIVPPIISMLAYHYLWMPYVNIINSNLMGHFDIPYIEDSGDIVSLMEDIEMDLRITIFFFFSVLIFLIMLIYLYLQG